MYEKVIRSGELLEFWSYEGTPINLQDAARKSQRGTSERKRYRTHARRRADNVRRATAAFRRLVRANLVGDSMPSFLTLTVLQELSIKASSGILTEFFVRLRKHFGRNVKYVVVPEFQKRGAVHFHGLIWGLPSDLPCTGYWVGKGKRRKFIHTCAKEKRCERSTRRLSRLWLRGFADCVITDGHARLSTYMSKYMSKALSDVRLGGEKAYHSSRNVLRPMSVGSHSFSDEVKKELGFDEIPFALHKFKTRYLGECTYEARKIP